jgi:cytochrome oxidase assembly protein ShyY1
MLVAKQLSRERICSPRDLAVSNKKVVSNKEVSPNKESFSLFKSAVALLLIAGCLWASQWQYHRGVDRHERNNLIETQTTLPSVKVVEASKNPIANEWREVKATGQFDSTQQILLRNRYFEGKYGFEVLTAFTAISGEKFWVDRGWVQAGATALEQPKLPPLPSGQVDINGRLRLDTSLPQGNFFALPSTGTGLISEANARSTNSKTGIDSEFYLDLLNGSVPELTPEVPAQLPELSDGPHFAYALQWVLFGALVIYGRYLIRREVLPRKELRVETGSAH